jgi:hypothetical protein
MKSSNIFVMTTLIICLGIGLLPLNMHAGDKDVNVVNTPNVNVVNTPNVNVSNTVPITGNVGISGTPNVNVANTPGVVVVNNETEPIHVISKNYEDTQLVYWGVLSAGQESPELNVKEYSQVRVIMDIGYGTDDLKAQVYAVLRPYGDDGPTEFFLIDPVNIAGSHMCYTAVYNTPGYIMKIRNATLSSDMRVVVYGRH